MFRFLLFAICLTLAAPAVAMLGRPSGQGALLVIVPPWVDGAALMRQAGGREVWPQRAPMAVLAQSDDPAFVARLRGLGVWAVLDGAIAMKICGVT